MKPFLLLWGLLVGTAVAGRAMTLAGQVVAPRGQLTADVAVELRPVLTGWVSGDLEELVRSYARLRRTTRMASDGTFVFTGVAPGSFLVRATATGLVAETPGPVVLVEDRPAPPVRLVLQQDAELTVQITPPRDRDGHAWIVVLAHGLDDRLEGPADDTGTWRRSGLLPRNYSLEVRKDHGIQVWERRQLQVVPGMQVVPVGFQPVALAGRVTRDGSPLRASLLFYAPDGSLVSWVEATADGSFRGDLPHPGRWTVRIVDWTRLPRREEQELDVPRPAGPEPVQLELQLPAISAAARRR
jgi:hypothetical protein